MLPGTKVARSSTKARSQLRGQLMLQPWVARKGTCHWLPVSSSMVLLPHVPSLYSTCASVGPNKYGAKLRNSIHNRCLIICFTEIIPCHCLHLHNIIASILLCVCVNKFVESHWVYTRDTTPHQPSAQQVEVYGTPLVHISPLTITWIVFDIQILYSKLQNNNHVYTNTIRIYIYISMSLSIYIYVYSPMLSNHRYREYHNMKAP